MSRICPSQFTKIGTEKPEIIYAQCRYLAFPSNPVFVRSLHAMNLKHMPMAKANS